MPLPTTMRSMALFWLVPGLATLSACSTDSTDDAQKADSTDETGETDETDTAPTWHGDIRPILHQRCGSCHVEGNIAPFVLDDYDTASSLADAIVASVDAGTMPPWFAVETDECEPRLPWKGDMRVSDEEKALLREWASTGTKLGDPDNPAPLTEPPPLELQDPKAEMEFAEPYAVQGESDDFQCFVLDPGHTEDVWLTGVQVLPGNTKVDHHALVYLDVYNESADLALGDQFPCFNAPDVSGFLVATWTPGAAPMYTPDGAGMPMPEGARIIVQMHYHPDPEAVELDQTVVQLEWTTEEPEWEAAQALVGNNSRQSSDGTGLQPGENDPTDEAEFIIPAGVSEHVETILYTQEVPIEFPLFSVGTHMHYVGTDMKIDLIQADGDEECLIQTPNWDFNWQRVYDYDAPVDQLPTIAAGDSLLMRCTYDNSLDNPFVVDALDEQGLDEPQDVHLGDETLDEMCLGLFGILVPPGLIQELY